MGETNAERLARILSARSQHCLSRKGERAVRTLWFQCVRADAAKLVLDILASWRICGACRFVNHRTSRGFDPGRYTVCGNRESPLHQKRVDTATGTCDHWTEKS